MTHLTEMTEGLWGRKKMKLIHVMTTTTIIIMSIIINYRYTDTDTISIVP